MTPPPADQERLRFALSFIDSHVRFAETKNAAVFAANAGALIAICRILLDANAPAGWEGRYLVSIVVFSLAAAIVALLSFLPVTEMPWIRRSGRGEATGSLLFFGDVQRHDAQTYIARFLASDGQEPRTVSEWERMLVDQIIVNSQIASRKFAYCRVALWCTVAALLTPVIAGALFVAVHDRS